MKARPLAGFSSARKAPLTTLLSCGLSYHPPSLLSILSFLPPQHPPSLIPQHPPSLTPQHPQHPPSLLSILSFLPPQHPPSLTPQHGTKLHPKPDLTVVFET
ncbi:hypothetical protein EYF80_025981 [Liparis tanakae]|uniref:Uncharacterized protein n=1 Tax=Liparis tanakae TaxID=230148 RepID=A0A4Z2HD65_9TELE|nr:hypothetical protein EYF80_025981 [Liparis tanakae]